MNKTQHSCAVIVALMFVSAANAAADDVGVPDDLAPIITDAAQRYELDERLLVAVARRESDFRRRLVSSAGARGVMQLMPETAATLGVRNCFNPRQNIFGGAKYLKQLEDMFDGDLDMMLAAYNAGPAAVRKYGGVPPYRETRAYVKSIRHELRGSGTAVVIDRQELFFGGRGAKRDCARLLTYDRVEREEE
jgi:soluble lytic murein transglycosylase-like protein